MATSDREGYRDIPGSGVFGGFLDTVFGQPVALREQVLQQEGALQRAGIAAGSARAALAEQQRQFNVQQQIMSDAATHWQQVVAQSAGPNGQPDLQGALRSFMMSPQFMRMPADHARVLQSLVRDPSGSEAFTLGPGQMRFGPAPPGQLPPVVGVNPQAPPRPYESSVDKARTDQLTAMADSGRQAQTQLQELEALSTPLLRSGEAFPGGTWRGAAASLGIPVGPRTTDIQVVQSILDGLTPLQRRGLPGAASDRDMATFRGRLPDLLRTAEGNREILTFLLAQARAQAQSGSIAAEAFTRQGADVGEIYARAGAVRFADILAATRAEVQERRDAIVEGSLGIDVRSIARMTDQELRSFVVQMRNRFPSGIPGGIQRRIQSRAEEISRSMDN